MAQRFLDQGNPVEAIQIAEEVLKKDKKNAMALLLRSTGRIMGGNLAAGFEDLQRALDLDPKLRQGWLNLAGLEIAEGRYDAAYSALREAQKLDPAAPDNELNLGAVLVMQSQLNRAAVHFDRYLASQGASAEAQYLVATNYAIGNSEDLAIAHLRRAIELDERNRLRARTDERFLGLKSLDYKVLLNTDVYTPPADAHQVAAGFRVPYSQRDNKLLYAVLDALTRLGEPYDPKIEANPRWALIWAEMRIKLSNQGDGTGVVSLSAPAERFTADVWHQRSQALFRAIHEILGG
ncbi:MAG: tetratricopeptide repeat protein [Acidobacteriota bacterium]